MPKVDKKSISVKVYFWSVKRGRGVEKGNAWAAGTLALESNECHEIKSDTRVFNSLEELFVKLHELLKDNNVSLVMGETEKVPRLGKGYPLKAGPWGR